MHRHETENVSAHQTAFSSIPLKEIRSDVAFISTWPAGRWLSGGWSGSLRFLRGHEALSNTIELSAGSANASYETLPSSVAQQNDAVG